MLKCTGRTSRQWLGNNADDLKPCQIIVLVFFLCSLELNLHVCFVFRLLHVDITCPENLRATSDCGTQTSAPLPVLGSLFQAEQVTGNRTQQQQLTNGGSCNLNLGSNTSTSSPEFPFQTCLKMRDDCSLPCSPHSGWRRRLPCSLPGSPLLGEGGGRPWRRPPMSQSLSRLWVEAALQRSKNTGRIKMNPPFPFSLQLGQEVEEGVRSRLRDKEEEGERQEWSNEEQEEQEQMNTVNIVGMKILDTIYSRGVEEGTVGGQNVPVLDSEMWKYCLLTPCICLR